VVAGAGYGGGDDRGEIAVQDNYVLDDGVQCIAVSPLDELRLRPNWCTGGSHAVREVLQCDDSGRTRPGGSRVARGERRRPSRRRQRKAQP
jgi:hypothetical protein